jgi:hypothetical protein
MDSGGEPAVGIVDGLLAESEAGHARLVMSAINAGEVYYFLRKQHGPSQAEFWRSASETLPIEVEAPVLEDIWSAASLKAIPHLIRRCLRGLPPV